MTANHPTSGPEWCKIPEAARILGRSEKSLRDALKDGAVPFTSVRVGRTWLILRRDISPPVAGDQTPTAARVSPPAAGPHVGSAPKADGGTIPDP